jgi:hypothetical protein
MENTYNISEKQLTDMLLLAAEATTIKVLTELGLKRSQVSQREAYSRYGGHRVRVWRSSGKIVPVKVGRNLYYDIHRLEVLKLANDYNG